MIELKPEDICEWDGFDVYDAETGERMSPSDIAEREIPQDPRLSLGQRLIQINGEKYMRW